jgi:hypothetical protein
VPEVAVRGDGTVYLAYRTNSGFSPAGRVAVRVRDPQGNLTPDLNLVQPAGSMNQSPHGMHVGPTGIGSVLWADNQAFGTLLLRRFSSAGVLDPETFEVAPSSANTGGGGVLAGDSAGNSIAVWRNSTLGRIELRRVTAAGVLEPVRLLTPDGVDVDVRPQLAIAPDGTAIVVWRENTGPAIQLRTVAPDGTIGPLQTLTSGGDPYNPLPAVDGAGNAYVVWNDVADNLVRMRTRSAAGALGAIETVSAGGAGQNAGIGVAGDGAAAIVWREGAPPSDQILGRRRTAAGSLGPIVPIAGSELGSGFQFPEINVESGGIATVVWENLVTDTFQARGFREDGAVDPVATVSDPNPYDVGIGDDGFGNTAVAVADISTKKIDAQLFDGGGPELRSLSVPSQVERGEPGSFSFVPFDLLSTVASSGWEFGDGGAANGTSATHSFALAGTFTVAGVSTDSVGNVRRVRRAVRVVDIRRPQMARLKLTPAKFRVGKRATARTAAKRKAKRRRAPAGTKISFRLSENARVRLSVQRRATGRQVGGGSGPQTPRHRGAKRCVRFVTVKGVVLVRAGKQGSNTVRFSGRVGRRKLAAGRYRLVARATDPSRNASKQALRAFRVVR